MRYYISNNTLFVRGSFYAASTGPCGGLHPVSTLLLHSPKGDYADREDPCREVALQVAREGLSPDFFGLLVGNDIRRLCILQYDYITVFIFRILARRSPSGPGRDRRIFRGRSRSKCPPADDRDGNQCKSPGDY